MKNGHTKFCPVKINHAKIELVWWLKLKSDKEGKMLEQIWGQNGFLSDKAEALFQQKMYYENPIFWGLNSYFWNKFPHTHTSQTSPLSFAVF